MVRIASVVERRLMTGSSREAIRVRSQIPAARFRRNLLLVSDVRAIRALLQAQHIEELADLVVALGRMPHRDVPVEQVAVTPSLAPTRDVPRIDEVGDDPLRRALRDAYGLCDIAQARTGAALQAKQHLGVAREEVPVS
jgi:hypothetical protein